MQQEFYTVIQVSGRMVCFVVPIFLFIAKIHYSAFHKSDAEDLGKIDANKN